MPLLDLDLPQALLGFLAVFVAFVILASVANRRRRERAQTLTQLAAQRGWRLKVTPTDEGDRWEYSGTTDGVAWRFIAGGGVAPRWETQQVTLQNEVLVVFTRKGKSVEEASGPITGVAKLALHAMTIAMQTGHQAADLIANAQSVRPRNAESIAYSFRATRPALMNRFLDLGATNALARDPKLVAVLIGGWGLKMLLAETECGIDRIAHLSRTGAALTIAAQKAKPEPVG